MPTSIVVGMLISGSMSHLTSSRRISRCSSHGSRTDLEQRASGRPTSRGACCPVRVGDEQRSRANSTSALHREQVDRATDAPLRTASRRRAAAAARRSRLMSCRSRGMLAMRSAPQQQVDEHGRAPRAGTRCRGTPARGTCAVLARHRLDQRERGAGDRELRREHGIARQAAPSRARRPRRRPRERTARSRCRRS